MTSEILLGNRVFNINVYSISIFVSDDTDQDPVHAVVPVLSAVGHVTRIDAIGVGIDTGGRETDLAVEKEERKGERDPSHP